MTNARSNNRGYHPGYLTAKDHSKSWWIVPIFLGLLFRVWLIEALPGSYDGSPHRQDGYQYDSLAWNLVRGYGFSLNHESAFDFDKCPPCQPTVLRTPGYPLFLAFFFKLFGRNYTIVKYVQAVLDIITCWLVYRLSLLVFSNHRIARLVLILAVLLPFTAVWVTDISSETVATFLCTLVIVLALRAAYSQHWQSAGVVGVIAGLAILVRPGFALMPLILLTTFWLRASLNWRDALKSSVCFMLIAILTLTPWLVRNYLNSNDLILADIYQYPEQEHVQGYQKWYLSWIRDGKWTHQAQWNYVVYPHTISDPPFPDYAYASAKERTMVENLMSQVKEASGFSQSVDEQFAVLGTTRSRNDPLRYFIILPLWRMIRAWINTGSASINWNALKSPFSLDMIGSQPSLFGLRLILALSHSAMLPLAILGVWLSRKQFRLIIPIALSICYHTVIMEHIGRGIQPRYLVYGFPVTVVFIAVSLMAAKDRIRWRPSTSYS